MPIVAHSHITYNTNYKLVDVYGVFDVIVTRRATRTLNYYTAGSKGAEVGGAVI